MEKGLNQSKITALFLNSGILGQRTFAQFVDRFVRDRDGIEVIQEIVTENLTFGERVVRRILCQRLWRDGWFGLKNMDFLRFRAELNAGWGARRRMRLLERQGKRFDVIHFHRQTMAYAMVLRMREIPSVVSIDCTQRCVYQAAGHALERWTYEPNIRRDGRIFRQAKAIISTSQWAADCVKEEYPDVHCEIDVMQNPVALSAFDPSWPAERAARAELPSFPPRLLFVGGDFPRKGGPVLLEAWRQGGFGERARLTIVTSWPLPPEQIPPGVEVITNVGAYSEVWKKLYRTADIFVMPTENEAFGMVYQEAAAAGLPCIGTRHNAVPEIVLHERTGLLVKPGDVAGLTEAIRTLLADPARRLAYGRAARAHIEQIADADLYAENLVGILRRAARASVAAHR